jgi:hypothetical protein
MSGLYERLLPFALPRRILAQAFTLFLVVIAWVFFRAANLEAAILMLQSMFNAAGTVPVAAAFGVDNAVALIAGAAAIALFAPNVIDIFARFHPVLALDRPNERQTPQFLLARLKWRPSAAWGLATGTLAACGALAILGWRSEFLYFQF